MLVKGESLTFDQAKDLMARIGGGSVRDSQIGAALMAMHKKKETSDEIAGFASALFEKALRITPKVSGKMTEVVGTGGGIHTIDISTISSFVVAGAGVPVAKHGNRSNTGICGSADLVEALGTNLMLDQEEVTKAIEAVGFGYLFAPLFHPAMRFVGNARKQMGITTIFNVLGPLINPAGVRNAVVGVYDEGMMERMCGALKILKYDKALVVCGVGPIDEITNTGETKVMEVDQGKVKQYAINPEDFGIKRCKVEEIAAVEPPKAAILCRQILTGTKGPARDAIVMNAAAGIYVSRKCGSLKEGIAMAEDSIDSFKAFKKLEQYISHTIV